MSFLLFQYYEFSRNTLYQYFVATLNLIPLRIVYILDKLMFILIYHITRRHLAELEGRKGET